MIVRPKQMDRQGRIHRAPLARRDRDVVWITIVVGVLANLTSLAALGLLPLGWLGCYLLCRTLAPPTAPLERDRRWSFIVASAMWGVGLVAITELLSASALLNRPSLLICWGLTDTLVWFLAIRRDQRGVRLYSVLREEWARVRTAVTTAAGWPLDLRLMLMAIILLLSLLGLVALLTPTGNWDSLAYHLPRVMHWTQQQSVAHYPAISPSQLEMGPWSAFLQTHVFLLLGSDRFANCIQWMALVGCLFNCTFITRCLADSADDNSLRRQIFTALLVATLPTAVVESITPQTDLVTAFWLTSAVSLFFVLWTNPESKTSLLGAGGAIGLGVLTKITMVIYLAVFVIVAAGWWVTQRRVLATVTWLALAICLAGAVNAPHAVRNFRAFGSPVGTSSTQSGTKNESVSLGGLASNILRNLALHTGTGIPALTKTLNSALEGLNALTGRPVNDPETSVYTRPKFAEDEFVIYDSETGNPYHLGLAIFAAALSLACAPRNRRLILYLSLVIASAVVFCAIMRWQPWSSRYHLPYFVVLMPVVSVAFVAFLPRWGTHSAALGLVAFAGVIIACNRSRPIFDPNYLSRPLVDKMVAAYIPPVADPLAMLVRDVLTSGCRYVGLHLDAHDPEYIFWVAFRDKGFTGRIDSHTPRNESAKILDGAPSPCVVITFNTNSPPPSFTRQFPFEYRYGAIIVFWAESASRWGELSVLDHVSKSIRVLASGTSSVPFTKGLLQLELRTARPGTLRLGGTVVAGKRLQVGRLRIDARHLVDQSFPLTGERLEFQVRAPAGHSLLNVALEETPLGTNLVMEDFTWLWTPD